MVKNFTCSTNYSEKCLIVEYGYLLFNKNLILSMSSIVPDTENWLFNVTLLENLIQSAIISLIFFKFYFKSDLLLKIQLYSKTFIIFYNLKIFEITIVTKESP